MSKFTPFEELQQFVGPSGPGSKKPCLNQSHIGSGISGYLNNNCLCGGAGFVLDTEAPRFKAMWQVCSRLRIPNTPIHLHTWDVDDTCIYDRKEHKGTAGKECNYRGCCQNSGFIPRSRAEAALLLLEALRKEGWYIAISPWGVEISRGSVHKTGGTMDRSTDWLDDLSLRCWRLRWWLQGRR